MATHVRRAFLTAFWIAMLPSVVFALDPAAPPSVDRQPASSQAVTRSGNVQPQTGMIQDEDGNLQVNEFEIISPNGSITRGLCPYSCEMRGVSKQHCKTWQSAQNPSLCYVQDMRIPSDAIAFGGGGDSR